jgi:hypothetical protein
MYLFLLMWRLLLELLGPTDGVKLAARADGRIEHVPAGPSLWQAWLSRVRSDLVRGAARALNVRASDRKAARGRKDAAVKAGRSPRAPA